MFFYNKFTTFGKILFAIGCLIPISIVTLVVLFILVIEIDDKWRTYGSSLSFEKRKSSFDLMILPFVEEIVVENEKKITLFGTKNEFKSENNKPVVLRTTDGGESWEKREIDIDVQSASFDRIGERVYIVGFVDDNDSVNRPVYVSNEDFKKWEYIGDAECEQIGKIHVNKNRGEKPYSIILERDNIPAINLGNLCNGIERYAQNDKDWIACGFDEKKSSTHEVRILHRTNEKYGIYTSFPDKWHLWRLNHVKPLDFYVKDSLMVGLFKFWMGADAWFRYLYYSVDGGKNWQNEKIPSFDKERLAVIKNNIIVLGVNYSYNEKKGKVTILTMPIPKN